MNYSRAQCHWQSVVHFLSGRCSMTAGLTFVLGAQLRGSSVSRAVLAVLRREGWRGLYAGVRAQLLGTGCGCWSQ